MKKKLVSIIIPNFNGESYLESCLSSVLKSKEKNFEVILVDDGSTDNSIKIINRFKKIDERVKLLRDKKNMGAAASRNKAVKKVTGNILVFLDNDTEVDRSWLTEILKPFVRDKTIGAVQGLLLDFNKRELIQMAGGKLIPHTGWLIPFYQWSRFDRVELEEREIVGISAALAVKREIYEKVSGFDEKEAIYTEDIDMCWRIWIAGFRIVLAPRSKIFHWTKSVDQRSGMKASYRQIYFHLAKNSFRSITKNYEPLNLLKYLPTSIFINVGRGFLFLLSKRSFDALIGSLSALGWLLINLLDTIKARRAVQMSRKFSDDYLMRRIFTSENPIQIYNKYFRK